MTSIDDIAAIDPSGQLADVRELPDHLRDALWRVESAGLRLDPAPGGLVVCGMGGSAIGGALAQACFGDRLEAPLHCVSGYRLPSWVPADALVLCCSYSGTTEETVECYRQATERGLRRVVVTTGGVLGASAREDGVPVIPIPAGLQPRCAVGYMLVSVLQVAAAAGVGPQLRSEVEAAAELISSSQGALEGQAETVAAAIEGSVPVVYGADLTAPVAYRWKTQVNENAKMPAFSHELPEADHNELVGWEGAPAPLGPYSAVFLCDTDHHRRDCQRIELTAELIADSAHSVQCVGAEGKTRTERVCGGVMLGDLVSLLLAASRGVDPAPVPVIERLKDQLGRPE
ncbi:MAG: bifunctional phosphoglucose/phosphomannose isomerase [Solirubrobacterales bacterium]